VDPQEQVTMPDPIITLTTDFGEDSPYVAAMKGVILGINPSARLVDLSHQIPPQDVRYSAFFLAEAIPCFPTGVIHVVVVDPGVGSDRALLHVEIAGQQLLVPDNGCWTLIRPVGTDSQYVLPPVRVTRLNESRYWRALVSNTFHGRDILAPVAGHVSLGVPASSLGQVVSEWVRLEMPAPRLEGDRLEGNVLFVDHFGNLITNIPGPAFLALAQREVQITVDGEEVPRWVAFYSEAPPGSLVALVSSGGTLEIAIVQGSAAHLLRAGVGAPVIVTLFP
jgi:S-adenosylmethionine hydrolase